MKGAFRKFERGQTPFELCILGSRFCFTEFLTSSIVLKIMIVGYDYNNDYFLTDDYQKTRTKLFLAEDQSDMQTDMEECISTKRKKR